MRELFDYLAGAPGSSPLHAIGASTQVAEVWRDCPADWWLPDEGLLANRVSIGPTAGKS